MTAKVFPGEGDRTMVRAVAAKIRTAVNDRRRWLLRNLLKAVKAEASQTDCEDEEAVERDLLSLPMPFSSGKSVISMSLAIVSSQNSCVIASTL
jgi:hypothetical protein